MLPKSDVTKVVRQGVRDSSADGAGGGTLVGFLIDRKREGTQVLYIAASVR